MTKPEEIVDVLRDATSYVLVKLKHACVLNIEYISDIEQLINRIKQLEEIFYSDEGEQWIKNNPKRAINILPDSIEFITEIIGHDRYKEIQEECESELIESNYTKE